MAKSRKNGISALRSDTLTGFLTFATKKIGELDALALANDYPEIQATTWTKLAQVADQLHVILRKTLPKHYNGIGCGVVMINNTFGPTAAAEVASILEQTISTKIVTTRDWVITAIAYQLLFEHPGTQHGHDVKKAEAEIANLIATAQDNVIEFVDDDSIDFTTLIRPPTAVEERQFWDPIVSSLPLDEELTVPS